jgi:hypothetical protein
MNLPFAVMGANVLHVLAMAHWQWRGGGALVSVDRIIKMGHFSSSRSLITWTGHKEERLGRKFGRASEPSGWPPRPGQKQGEILVDFFPIEAATGQLGELTDSFILLVEVATVRRAAGMRCRDIEAAEYRREPGNGGHLQLFRGRRRECRKDTPHERDGRMSRKKNNLIKGGVRGNGAPPKIANFRSEIRAGKQDSGRLLHASSTNTHETFFRCLREPENLMDIGYPIIDSDQGHQKRERSGSEGKGRRGEERRV